MDEAKRNIDATIEKNEQMRKVAEEDGFSTSNKALGKLPDIEKKMDEVN